MNHENDKISSYFASPYFIGAVLFFAFICAYFGLNLAFAYLVFISLLSTAALAWGKYSGYGITVSMDTDSSRIYPGEDIVLTFTLQNNKFLPLVWLEWNQPYPQNNCLEIPTDFEEDEYSLMQEDKIITIPILCKRFSFIKWYSTITWNTTFHASRRGVYIPNPIGIQTGDGFGLSVNHKQYELSSPPVIVIYPKKVEVRTDVFFKNTWSASTGPHGVIEDVTVLKGIRDYEKTDSFKRINWRLAARNEDLSVNIYDTISPCSVYFFVDTTTFYGLSEDNVEFEDTLSVIASVIAELFSKGMSVGLYLPTASNQEYLDLELDFASVEDCLLALTLSTCDNPDAQFNPQSCAQLLSTQSGKIYYICYSAETTRCIHLFEDVGISSFSIISYQQPSNDNVTAVDLSTTSLHLISDFKTR